MLDAENNVQKPAPASEVPEQWATFYDNINQPDVAKDFRELSSEQPSQPSTPQEQWAAFYDNMGQPGIAEEFRELSQITNSEPTTSHNAAAPITSASQINHVASPDISAPAESQPSHTDDTVPTNDTAQPTQSSVEQSTPEQAPIDEKAKDIAYAKSASQKLEEIAKVNAREEIRPDNENTISKNRGHKVFEALARRRVEEALRRAEHARVETFDSSYRHNHPVTHLKTNTETSQPQTTTVANDTAQPTQSSVEQSTPEQAPIDEKAKDIAYAKSASQKLEEIAKVNAREEKEHQEQNDVENKNPISTTEEPNTLSNQDLHEIVANAQLQADLAKKTADELQTEIDNYLEEADLLEIALLTRGDPSTRQKRGDVKREDYQKIYEHADYFKELDAKATDELKSELAKYKNGIPLRRHVLAQKRKSQESLDHAA